MGRAMCMRTAQMLIDLSCCVATGGAIGAPALPTSPMSPHDVPMVAYVYSKFRPGVDKTLHDRALSELAWPQHKWENVKVGSLARNLDCYDLLFCHGIYNTGNPQDFNAYREKWLEFLERGGVIVAAGIQDHPMQWDWIVNLGTDFRFDLKTYKSFQKSSGWYNRNADLLFGPVEARWAEFASWSPAWTVTNRNANGGPITIYQAAGKGLLVVSTSYHDAFPGKEDLARIWQFARKESRQSPIRIVDVSWGQMQFGENTMGVLLTTDSQGMRNVEVSLTIFSPHRPPVRQARRISFVGGADTRLSMDYTLTGGDNEISLTVRGTDDGRVYARTGARREFPDAWASLARMKRDLTQVEQGIDRLKDWPDKLLSMLSAAHVRLEKEAAALEMELSKAHTGLAELQRATGSSAAKAKLLAARVTGWNNMGFAPGRDEVFAVFATDALHKIYRDRPWSARTPKKALSIALARNEYESAQVVIVPLAGPLTNVRVSCEELRSTNDVIDNIQVRPVADCFLPLEGDHGGWHPDVLLKNAPFEIPGDRLAQSVWITVHCSSDTSAGDYTGTVTVGAEGAEPVKLPIKVTVWDFVVPQKCNLPTQFQFRPNQVAAFYFGENARRGYWKYLTAPMYRTLVKFLLGYRIAVHPYDDFEGRSKSAIGYLGEARDDRGEVVHLDFTEYDRHMQLLCDYGQDLLYAGCWLRGTIEQQGPYWHSFLPRMYEHLKAKGWDDMAILYGYDEAPPAEIPIVRSHYALVKQLAPAVRYLLTYHTAGAAPAPEEPGYADIWVPQGGFYSRKLAAERTMYGQATWRYIVPGFEIYRPTSDYRDTFWNVWRDRCQGFLYFCTAFWHWGPSPDDFEPDGAPRRTFLPKRKGATGIYHLCYPAGTRPADGLNASIRLEAIRDGLEDWEYLNMLRKLTEQREDSESSVVREALALMQRIDTGSGAGLRTDRARVARAIRTLGAPRELQADN